MELTEISVPKSSQTKRGVMQGLWVGKRLTTLQRLSIASFLAHDHEFHLYTYDTVENVPPGTIVLDGTDILPESMIFKNTQFHTYAAFSDYFRYQLLLQKGGWWVDVDTVCLRPFEFADEYVFSSEYELCGEITNCGVIKAPAGAPVIEYAWDVCRSKPRDNLDWCEIGPDLVAAAVERFELQRFVQPAACFCPVPVHLWDKVIKTDRVFDFGRSTHALHLWNSVWTRTRTDPDATYPPDCLYEQLKTLYLAKEPIEPSRRRFHLL